MLNRSFKLQYSNLLTFYLIKMTKNTKTISSKTKKKKDAVHASVMKLLNNPSNSDQENYHYRLKMLEFNNMKTLETVKMGINVTTDAMRKILKNSSLNSKQKGEVFLVALMTAYKVLEELIKSIDKND